MRVRLSFQKGEQRTYVPDERGDFDVIPHVVKANFDNLFAVVGPAIAELREKIDAMSTAYGKVLAAVSFSGKQFRETNNTGGVGVTSGNAVAEDDYWLTPCCMDFSNCTQRCRARTATPHAAEETCEHEQSIGSGEDIHGESVPDVRNSETVRGITVRPDEAVYNRAYVEELCQEIKFLRDQEQTTQHYISSLHERINELEHVNSVPYELESFGWKNSAAIYSDRIADRFPNLSEEELLRIGEFTETNVHLALENAQESVRDDIARHKIRARTSDEAVYNRRWVEDLERFKKQIVFEETLVTTVTKEELAELRADKARMDWALSHTMPRWSRSGIDDVLAGRTKACEVEDMELAELRKDQRRMDLLVERKFTSRKYCDEEMEK